MNIEKHNDFKRLAAMHQTGRTTPSFIAAYLQLSARHVRRLLAGFHSPKQKIAWNRIGKEVREYLITEKREHQNYNCQWLAELASDRFLRPLSRSTVWRVLKNEGLLHGKPDTPVLRKRFEAQASGDLVQMDTTWGYWLGGRRLYLILLLDDHSRMILRGRFFLEETLWHNMTMIRETVEKHGKFKVLYTDNASWFKAIRHDRSFYQRHRQHEYESEITRACRDLGIVHVTHKPYEPQGKGKVERIFRFIQERFVSELDDPHMDLWLINKKWDEWSRWYNARHKNRTTGETAQKRFDPKGFKPLSDTEREKLDDIFCIRETRTVDKCNQFSYQGRVYVIPGSRTYAHQKVDLAIVPGRKIRVWHLTKLVAEFS
jgi:transposase InsO family protein